jgi:sulfur carrier protein
VKVTINGEEREFEAPPELSHLVTQWLCRDEPRGVAVAINGGVVRQSQWNSVELRDGDVVEIVEVVIGG